MSEITQLNEKITDLLGHFVALEEKNQSALNAIHNRQKILEDMDPGIDKNRIGYAGNPAVTFKYQGASLSGPVGATPTQLPLHWKGQLVESRTPGD